jgi:hypothetical protein
MKRAFFLFVALGGAAAACSLGLDPSLIGAGADGGVDGSGPGADGGDAAVSADGAPIDPGARECTKDADCKPPNACASAARCDTSIGVCVFDVCNVGACKAAACDTNANTCTVPVSHGYHASQFRVNLGPVGCGGDPRRCFAAAHPFVFVGTTNGLVAYQVGDPVNTSPPQITVTGLSFIPQRVVGVDRRVFFLGSRQGSGPSTYRLPVAWVDVPGNPLLTTLAAKSALVSIPANDFRWTLPNDKYGLFLVHDDRVFPTSVLDVPANDTTTLGMFPSNGAPQGSTIAASSGSRLLTFRWDGSNTSYLGLFSFETQAGTGGAQNGGEVSAGPMGQIYPQGFFTQTTGGTVGWSVSSVVVPGDGGPQSTVAARFAWLVADKNATAIDPAQRVDVETYGGLGYGSTVAGPPAIIDDKTALVLAASPGDRSQTSVQVATRAQTPASLVANRRFVLPVDVNRVASAASNGFGYVLAIDDGQPTSTVHVFAPGCQ